MVRYMSDSVPLCTWLFQVKIVLLLQDLIIGIDMLLPSCSTFQLLSLCVTYKMSPQLELSLGAVLGIGGFCTVSEVSSIRLLDANLSRDDGAPHILQDRKYMSKNFLRNGKDARYAIKTLSSSLLKDPERFVAGVIDLELETKFLSILRHPVSAANEIMAWDSNGCYLR